MCPVDSLHSTSSDCTLHHQPFSPGALNCSGLEHFSEKPQTLLSGIRHGGNPLPLYGGGTETWGEGGTWQVSQSTSERLCALGPEDFLVPSWFTLQPGDILPGTGRLPGKIAPLCPFSQRCLWVLNTPTTVPAAPGFSQSGNRQALCFASCGAFILLCVKSLQPCRLSATPRTVACQVPLSMGFSGPEYWSVLPAFPFSRGSSPPRD